MDRRKLLAIALPTLLAAGSGVAFAYDNPRRRVRRLGVRRRYRRVAFTRVRFGRPFWVVPVRLSVGWELMHRDRVVVVREIRHVERDGGKSEVAVVEDANGKTEQVEITREDTARNAENLEGSVLPQGDVTSSGIETESTR